MAKAMKAARVGKALPRATQGNKQQQALVAQLRKTIRRMRHAKKKQVAELKEEIDFLEVCLEWYYQLIPESARHMVMTEAADAAKVVSMSRSEAEVLGGSTWSASLGMFSKNQSLARFCTSRSQA